MKKIEIDIAPKKYARTQHTGLLGLAIVAVIQIASVSVIDDALLLSIVFFSMSIPASACSIWMLDEEIRREYSFNANLRIVPLLASFTLPIGGLTAVFFHFSLLTGVLFLLTSVTLIMIYAWFISTLDEVNRKTGSQIKH